MKSDIQGCSTCKPGQEQWEQYYSSTLGEDRVQYDYRALDGELFSCNAKTLEEARGKKNDWIWTK